MQWQYVVLFGSMAFILAAYSFLSWHETRQWLPRHRDSDTALVVFFVIWAMTFCLQIVSEQAKESRKARNAAVMEAALQEWSR